jgi:hypothetical protein
VDRFRATSSSDRPSCLPTATCGCMHACKAYTDRGLTARCSRGPPDWATDGLVTIESVSWNRALLCVHDGEATHRHSARGRTYAGRWSALRWRCSSAVQRSAYSARSSRPPWRSLDHTDKAQYASRTLRMADDDAEVHTCLYLSRCDSKGHA